MKLKSKKLSHIMLLSLIVYLVIILMLLFLLQILSFDRYYKRYKIRQVGEIARKIKKDEDISYAKLEDYAYDYGACISVYKSDETQIVSTIDNKGCIFSNKKDSSYYINDFIKNNFDEKEYYIKNSRFNNETIIKGIKFKDYYVLINASIEPLDSSKDLLKTLYNYIAVILAIISIIIAYFISNQISSPIEQLSTSAKKLANGKLSTKFTTNTRIVELNELSKALELAKNELSKTDELRRDLMANVGHDLRTPLTMIKAYAEMSRDLNNQTEEKRKENMNIIIEETDRLNVLVGDILDLSKIQSKTYELNIEEFDLNALIKNIIKRYYFLIDKDGYSFIYNYMNNDKVIKVKGDKKRIEQVTYNLINNAVNYTGKDKKIYINITENEKNVRVEIKDTGKGIKEEEIKYIWDKYYHNEKKHKRNTFGTGLGLSIVKTILESHNYDYGVISNKGEGSTFFFEIKK